MVGPAHISSIQPTNSTASPKSDVNFLDVIFDDKRARAPTRHRGFLSVRFRVRTSSDACARVSARRLGQSSSRGTHFDRTCAAVFRYRANTQ